MRAGLYRVSSSGAPTVTLPPFPGTVVPAVWLDASQQAYSDSAGTLPVSSGLIRRINEPSPLSASWLSPTDNERPLAEAGAVRFEIQGAAGGSELVRTGASSVSSAACTLVVSYVARDNAFAGPQVGLIRSDDGRVGVVISSNQVWVYYNGYTIWFSPLIVAHGKRNTIVVRYTATGINLLVNADGVTTTASLIASVTAATITADWRVAVTGTGYLYGSIPQALAVARTVDDAERTALAAWAHAQPAGVAYPTDRPLIAFVGDSITRMTAADYGRGYPFLALASVRAAGYLAEVCDTAVGGTGITRILDPTGSDNSTLLLRANAFYSASRTKNVMVIALGTNDLANNNPVAYILYGTAPPSYPLSGLYPAIDYAVAAGWLVVVVTPGPRTDSMAVLQATYNSRRTTVCDDLVANAAAHGYRVVDTRGITNFGGPSDSDNPTYYSPDKIHPVNAGHALLAPAVTAAVLAALAA